MTRYEPVTFADVKVGDTIKSVSPCGTVRRGVVDHIAELTRLVYDKDGNLLAAHNWTLYRRTPKLAKFVPLDVPAPAEPEGFGYVGYVTADSGEVADITRGFGSGDNWYYAISRNDGCHFGRLPWASVLALGTFTAVTR